MGFIRRQEERMAMRLLAWQYQRQQQPLPGAAALRRQAEGIVDQAHQIARRRGGNLAAILKELVADLRRP